MVHAAKLLQRKKRSAAPVWLFGLVMMVVGVVAVVQPSSNDHPAVVLFPILFGVLLVVMPWMTSWQVRRMYRNTPVMQEWRTLKLNENGLHFESISSESRLSWNVFVRLLEDKYNFVLVQQGKQIGIPLPKGALNQHEVEQLRLLLEEHLPRK